MYDEYEKCSYANMVANMLRNERAQKAIKPCAESFVRAIILGFLIPVVGPLLFLGNEMRMRSYLLAVGGAGFIIPQVKNQSMVPGLCFFLVAATYNILLFGIAATIVLGLLKALAALGIGSFAIGCAAIAICYAGAILRLRFSRQISAFINIACRNAYKESPSPELRVLDAFNVKRVLELLRSCHQDALQPAMDADMEHNGLVAQLLVKSVLFMSIVPAIFALLALGPWGLPAWISFAPMIFGMVPFFGKVPYIAFKANRLVFRAVSLFGVVPLIEANSEKVVAHALRASLLYGIACRTANRRYMHCE